MEQPMYEISLDRVANQPVSEGIHLFQVRAIEEGESSNHNPMWTVRLTCLDEGPDQGKETTMWLVLTESARWKLEKFFDAVKAPTTGTVDYTKFIGRSFKGQVTHENRDGRINANIGEMFPASSAPAAPKAASAPVVKATATPTVNRTAGGPVKTTVPAPVPATKKIGSKGLPVDSTDGDIQF
jgi:hypothetical protein